MWGGRVKIREFTREGIEEPGGGGVAPYGKGRETGTDKKGE